MDVDAWGTEAAGVFVDDGLALGAYFEGVDFEMGEQQTGLDGDAARAEADVPEDVTAGQVEVLEGEQADGHLGDHLLAAVEESEAGVGEAE